MTSRTVLRFTVLRRGDPAPKRDRLGPAGFTRLVFGGRPFMAARIAPPRSFCQTRSPSRVTFRLLGTCPCLILIGKADHYRAPDASSAEPEILMNYVDAHVHVWTDDTAHYPLGKGWKKEDMKPAVFTPE